MAVLPTDLVSKNTHVAQRMFDERMLVITAKDSMLHKLNDVGTFIWKTIDKPLSVGKLGNLIQNTYEGFDSEHDLPVVCDFLQALEHKNLVLIQRSQK